MSDIESKEGFKIENIEKDINDFNFLSAFFLTKKKYKNLKKSKQ